MTLPATDGGTGLTARPAVASRTRLTAIGRTVLRKLVDIVVVLFVAATFVFLVLQLMPGDPVDVLLKGIFEITPAVRQEVIADYGLDRPVLEQYWRFISGIVQGDLGHSYQMRQPVTEIIAGSIGPTAVLAAAALGLAIVFAVIGATASAGRGPIASLVTQTLELLAISVPSFWIGLLLLTAFSFNLPIFPSSGARGIESLVLPAITLAIPVTGILAQILRERMDETLEQPFVITARTRGAGDARVRIVHVLRHAVLPALNFSGAVLGSLLIGTAVIETLFARPGLGRVLLQAVIANDMPLIMGIIVFGALVFVVVNSLVDIIAAAIDPRLRIEAGVRSAW
ncbi:MAG TPA: ABC transporter permease [Microbacteriaceae bacterium]|nr:ABC transporter permease [Microbacteriaceae bacterium]